MIARGKLAVVASALGLALAVGTSTPVAAAVAEDDVPTVARAVARTGRCRAAGRPSSGTGGS